MSLFLLSFLLSFLQKEDIQPIDNFHKYLFEYYTKQNFMAVEIDPLNFETREDTSDFYILRFKVLVQHNSPWVAGDTISANCPKVFFPIIIQKECLPFFDRVFMEVAKEKKNYVVSPKALDVSAVHSIIIEKDPMGLYYLPKSGFVGDIEVGGQILLLTEYEEYQACMTAFEGYKKWLLEHKQQKTIGIDTFIINNSRTEFVIIAQFKNGLLDGRMEVYHGWWLVLECFFRRDKPAETWIKWEEYTTFFEDGPEEYEYYWVADHYCINAQGKITKQWSLSQEEIDTLEPKAYIDY